jgi:glc operon protein GlcG
MMVACKQEALRNHWGVTIAIVDDGGYLLALERLEGASATTPAIASGKARTAALLQTPTRNLEDRIQNRPAMLRITEFLPLQGGVPILYQGDCVGAIGVSGVQSHEDEQVAQAGVDALG